jgi:hypothetical protein
MLGVTVGVRWALRRPASPGLRATDGLDAGCERLDALRPRSRAGRREPGGWNQAGCSQIRVTGRGGLCHSQRASNIPKITE